MNRIFVIIALVAILCSEAVCASDMQNKVWYEVMSKFCQQFDLLKLIYSPRGHYVKEAEYAGDMHKKG
jgi:hypothetical protein